MNTKEIQQVMSNNEQFLSLYEYKGTPSKMTGLGKLVYDAAKAQGIQIRYKDLPEENQREEYKRIATYPTSFLDSYFGRETQQPTGSNELQQILQRLQQLEAKFDEVIKKLEPTPTKLEDDYDLPF
jgi:predicted ribosome quality control (RQC) complex YloA/Tae2 family protein